MRETIIAIHWIDDRPEYVFPLTFEYLMESGEWLGLCLELGTATSADTLEDIKSQLNDAVELQLNEVERLGFVNEYLLQNNVHIRALSAHKSAAAGDRQKFQLTMAE